MGLGLSNFSGALYEAKILYSCLSCSVLQYCFGAPWNCATLKLPLVGGHCPLAGVEVILSHQSVSVSAYRKDSFVLCLREQMFLAKSDHQDSTKQK